MSSERVKKEVSDTLKSKLDEAQNRLKPFEDPFSHKRQKEITIFFPQDRSFLLKSAPEHNRLNAFVETISREAGGEKVFLTVIGSASA